MKRAERVAEIIGDWLAQREGGRWPDPEEVVAAHPELARELGARFQAMALVDQAMSALPDLPVPEVLGEYRILREIGRGGMGVVYEAEQASMGRRVALKVLFPGVTTSRRAVERFAREAKAAGRLKHTNIVSVHGMGHRDGMWFYAMELVEGRPLSAVIADGDRLPHVRIARMFGGVAEALEAAHASGVIHRDVKPSNLLLEPPDTLRLVDFGLARLEDDQPAVTRTGEVMGTPLYMAPEQIRGDRARVGPRTDVYALGTTLYEVLAHRHPLGGSNAGEIAARVLTEDPRPLRSIDRRVPRDLATIVAKAMEKRPEDRYASAAAMAEDLQRFAVGAPVRARRIGLATRAWRRAKRHKVLSTALLALGLALGGVAWFAREASERAEAVRLLRYDELCRRGRTALLRTGEGRNEENLLLYPGETAAEILGRAIDLAPERPQAWFGRALALGRTPAEKLADLDAARERGLAPRLTMLGRALVLTHAGQLEEARAAEAAAAGAEGPAAEAAYFEGRLLEGRGGLDEAEARYGTVLADAPEESFLHGLALTARVLLRRNRGEFARALEDAAAIQGLDRESYGAGVLMADLWARLGKGEESQKILDALRSRALTENAESAWRDVVRSCATIGDHNDWTLSFVEAGLAAFPESAGLWFEQAQVLNKLGRFAEAGEAASRAAALDPTDARSSAMVAEALTHDLPHALRAAQRARELGLSESLFHGLQAHVYLAHGRYAQAEAACRAALALDPSNPVSWQNLAYALSQQHRAEESLEAAERGLALRPHDPELLHDKGIALMRTGRSRESLPYLRRALAWREKPGVRVDLAFVHALLGEFEASRDAADAALGVLDGWPDSERKRYLRALSLAHRAWARFKLGQATEAEADFEAGIAADPDEPQVVAQRARMLNDQGRYAEAEVLARRGVANDEHHHLAWEQLGRALGGLGRLDEALPANRRAVKLHPGCSNAHFYLGITLVQMGELDAGIGECTEACRLDPSDVAPLLNRALAYARKGERESAERDFHAALALTPDNVNVHDSYATFLRETGHLDQLVARCAAACGRPDGSWERARWRAYHLLHHLGDVPGGLAAVQHALEARGEPDVDLEDLHAMALLKSGRWQDALAPLDYLLQHAPDHPFADYNKAYALWQLGRREEAVALHELCARRRPDWAQAHAGFVSALMALGWWQRAEEAVDEAIKLHPDVALFVDQKAELLVRRGAGDEALKLVESARTRWKDDRALLFKHAVLLAEHDRFAEALTVWEAYLAQQPTPDGVDNALVAAGHVCDWPRMLELARLGTRLRPGDGFFLGMEALALLRTGAGDEAIARAAEASQATSRREPFVDQIRITVLGMAGRTDEALALARKTYAGAPVQFAYELVWILRVAGRAEEAREVAARHAEDPAPGGDELRVAYVLAVAGRSEEARKLLASAPPFSARMRVDHARVHAVLGDEVRARELLDEALAAGVRLAPGVGVDPDLAPVLTPRQLERMRVPR